MIEIPMRHMKARRLAFSADRTPPTAAARRAVRLVATSGAADRAPGIVTSDRRDEERGQHQELAPRAHEGDDEDEQREVDHVPVQERAGGSSSARLAGGLRPGPRRPSSRRTGRPAAGNIRIWLERRKSVGPPESTLTNEDRARAPAR